MRNENKLDISAEDLNKIGEQVAIELIESSWNDIIKDLHTCIENDEDSLFWKRIKRIK